MLSTYENQPLFIGQGSVELSPSHGTLVNGTYWPSPNYFNRHNGSAVNLLGQPLGGCSPGPCYDLCIVAGSPYYITVESRPTLYVNITLAHLYVTNGREFSLPLYITDPDDDTVEGTLYIGEVAGTSLRGVTMHGPLSLLAKRVRDNVTLAAYRTTEVNIRIYRPMFVGEVTAQIYVGNDVQYSYILGISCMFGAVFLVLLFIWERGRRTRSRSISSVTASSV